MRRLPRDRTLQRLAQSGTLTDEHLIATGRRLAGFYRSQPPVCRSGEEYLQLLRVEHDRNRRDLLPYPGTVAMSQVRDLLDAHSAMLNDESALFDARVTAGHVIEGHGDLRPEHVCLEDSEPIIFDCLEFDRRLRIVDAVDELMFLALELERLDRPDARGILLVTYEDETRDRPPDRLVRFYTSNRAAIWARLAVWRSRELPDDRRGHWLARSDAYLALAERYRP
jgi:aminoglycoside phosphotransferase family enzyme